MPSRTLTVRTELNYIRTNGRDGLISDGKGTRVKVSWDAHTGYGVAYKSRMGEMWSSTIDPAKGRDIFVNWPKEWADWRESAENPRQSYKGRSLYTPSNAVIEAAAQDRIRKAVTSRPQHQDRILDEAEVAGLTRDDLLSALFALEMAGEVVQMPGKNFVRGAVENPRGPAFADWQPDWLDLNDWVLANQPELYASTKYLNNMYSRYAVWLGAWERAGRPALSAKRNPAFLPKSLFDRYIVRTSGGEVEARDIQTLSGAERKAKEFSRKYPCAGIEIVSDKHGSVIKSFKPTMTGTAKVDQDNTRSYLKDQKAEARKEVKYALYIDGEHYADYDTEGEAKATGKAEGKGKSVRIKAVAGNPYAGLAGGTLETGDDAFFDTFSGSIPCKVLSIAGHSGAPGSAQTIRVKLTAKRGAYKAGEIIESNGLHIVPRKAVHGNRIRSNYQVIADSERNPGVSNSVHHRRIQRIHGRENPSLELPDSDIYHKGVRTVPGYTGKRGTLHSPLSRLANVGIIRAAFRDYTKDDHARRAKQLHRIAEDAGAAWSTLWEESFFKTYGRKPAFHEARISGVGDQGLPERDKDELRRLAQLKGEANHLAHWHEKAAGVTVMRRNPSSQFIDYRGFVLHDRGGSWLPMVQTSTGNLKFLNGSQTRGVDGSEADAKRLIDDIISGEYRWMRQDKDVAKALKRKNPEGDDSSTATALYEQFHGVPSDGEFDYVDAVIVPDTFAGLGDLVELWVLPVHGKGNKSVKIAAPDPDRNDLHEIVKLASNPEGTQLYFIGGDQQLNVEALGFSADEIKPHMVIGVLTELTYLTAKKFHKLIPTQYFHKTGEETGVEPMLCYDPVNCQMSVVGGAYKVKPEGIVN